MKREDLYNAMTEIDDRFIEEAEGYKFKKKNNIIKITRYLASAAAILLVGFVGFSIYENTAKLSTDTTAMSTNLMTIVADKSVVSESEAECVTEDMTNGILSGEMLFAAEMPKTSEYSEFGNDEYKEKAELWYDNQAEREEYRTTLSDKEGDFSYRLLQATLSEKENTIVSPMNIYLALGMLAEVTDGNSRQQLLGALNETSMAELREKAFSLYKYNYVNDGRVTSTPGSSIWLSDEFIYKKSPLETLANIYYADSFSGTMGSDHFNSLFRDWMNNHTGNMLKDQISGLGFNYDTVAAITTTLYFKNSWSKKFEEFGTRDNVFHGLKEEKVPFMNKNERGSIYYGTKFTASKLYMDENYSMMFVLPEEGTTPAELMQDKEALSFILSPSNAPSLRNGMIHYSIPKFDVDSQLELNDICKKLGITDVFDGNVSDFSNLTDDVEKMLVSKILHGARVKIDEDGCEAAAYTMIMVENATAIRDDEIIDFTVDRPFIFVIQNPAGMPLFVGTVYTVK